MQNISKEKWNLIKEHFEYIETNLDMCCQSLCEGQECKHRLEEIMKELSVLRK